MALTARTWRRSRDRGEADTGSAFPSLCIVRRVFVADMRWRYMFSSLGMGKFCNRHGSLAVCEQKPPYLLLARGCSSGGMQHKHSRVIKAQDPDWPVTIVDDNSWKNTEGGKYIFLHGKRYDRGDPEFIRLRNENILKHADELADMFDFSHGGSLVEALRQLRNIETQKKQGREDVIGGSLLGPLDDAVGSVKKTMQSGGTEEDTDNKHLST